MKRTFRFEEEKINEMIRSRFKGDYEMNEIRLKMMEGKVELGLTTAFAMNPIIRMDLRPAGISKDEAGYSLRLKKENLTVVSQSGEDYGDKLPIGSMVSMAENKLTETGYFKFIGDFIHFQIDKDSEVGKMAELFPELVDKAIETSEIRIETGAILLDTEIQDWDIKAALLRNPAALGRILSFMGKN